MDICTTQKCTGCGLCSVVCPKQCIKMKDNFEGFFYPSIDSKLCVDCRTCRKLCPSIENKNVRNNNISQKCYAFQNIDNEILVESSSGGFFTGAAKKILERQGIVYAAVLDDQYVLKHIRIENPNKLVDARKSKYLQSRAWEVYKSILEDSKLNRPLLFVGTPCQVAAVKKYVNNVNLFTIDLVCHGVANSMIVKKYAESIEKKYSSKIHKFFFRYKQKESTNQVKMHIEFENGNVYEANSLEDAFLRGFNSNIFLRESCYQCEYANLDRVGDITIGDFWGLDSISSTALNTSKGVNFVKVNTKKGQSLLEIMRETGLFEEHNIKEAMLHNRTLKKPMRKNIKRTNFFKKIEQENFIDLSLKMTKSYKVERMFKFYRDKLISKKMLWKTRES